MNQPTPATDQPPVTESGVYVLAVRHHDDLEILRISTTLEDAQNYYGPNSLSKVKPWEPVKNPYHPNTIDLWRTQFASGNNGATIYIRRMPLRTPTTTRPHAVAEAIITTTTTTTTDDRYDRLRDGLLALIPTNDPELIEAGYPIPASDILALLDPTTGTQADLSLATMVNVEAFRDDFHMAVPGISDGDLITLMNTDPELIAIARQWGWNETQVRDEFADILKTHGHTLD